MTNTRSLIIPALAMTIVIVASNILVQYPLPGVALGVTLGDWLTYGAFTYPFAFLVTDLTNRGQGAVAARRVAYIGFALAVVLSFVLADPRIALASGTAFLTAQLLDVSIFNALRKGVWWQAPLISSAIAAAIDTILFFSIAFAGTGLPWITMSIGDYAAKIAMVLFLLIPYRIGMSFVMDRDARVAGTFS